MLSIFIHNTGSDLDFALGHGTRRVLSVGRKPRIFVTAVRTAS